jgi:peptide/nickel transport system permease protein
MVSRGNERAEPIGGTAATGATTATENRSRLERAALKKSPGYFTRAWRRFRRNKLSLAALAVFLLMCLFAFSAPLVSTFVTQQSYQAIDLQNTFARPRTTVTGIDWAAGGTEVTKTHLLGTDESGRDVLTRLAYGGRISLMVAFIAMALALTLGVLIGALAGFYGGALDSILMRFVDAIIAIPGLFILILVSSMLNNNKVITDMELYRQAGWLVLPLAIALLGWTGVSRLIRGEFLSIKNRDYVEAARVLGAGDGRIIFRHILPNVVPLIITFATLAIPGLILAEASLSYLGFGVQIPTPSWGNMLTKSTDYFSRARHLIILPGLMIYITTMSVRLVGNGLRDALDPRLND